jgi:hypothetical protein
MQGPTNKPTSHESTIFDFNNFDYPMPWYRAE